MIQKLAVFIYAFAVSIVVFVWVLCQCARQRGIRQSTFGIKQTQKFENRKTPTTETRKSVANTAESSQSTIQSSEKSPLSKEPTTTSMEKTSTGKSEEKPSPRNLKPSLRKGKSKEKSTLRHSKEKGILRRSAFSESNEKAPNRLRTFLNKFSYNEVDRKTKKNQTFLSSDSQSLESDDKRKQILSQSKKKEKICWRCVKNGRKRFEIVG